ncbi:uncharacterized protein LOC142239590 [Haematobia irritans]|uniref:uncharacterized protein LOC142239590 n=1 Tax=Haematobia irritans TaxID=7368 RepID=UPI003F50C257
MQYGVAESWFCNGNGKRKDGKTKTTAEIGGKTEMGKTFQEITLMDVPINQVSDVDSLIDQTNVLLSNAIEESVPKTVLCVKYVKRLPRHILNLISMRNTSRRNWIRYRMLFYRSETIFLNKLIAESTFRFRNSNWNNMLSSLDTASSKFWNISKIIKRKTGTVPSMKQNGCVYTTNLEKAELLAQKFHSNHRFSENLSDSATTNMVSETIRNIDSQVNPVGSFAATATQLKNIIRNLKIKKSSVPDGITNRCLKSLPPSGLRTFQVHIGNAMSSVHTSPAGCPQGSCLSPLLYNIYTYDFPELDGCKSSIFADDTAILCSGVFASDIMSDIQVALREVSNYFKRWKIVVNTSKTQAIFFSRRRRSCYIPSSNIIIDNFDIPWDDKKIKAVYSQQINNS